MPNNIYSDNEQANLAKLTGASGSLFIDGTNAVTGNFFGFVVNTDCVINAVLVSSFDGTTYVNQTRADLTNKTISAGRFISANTGAYPAAKCYISSIQLTSGDVIAYYN